MKKATKERIVQLMKEVKFPPFPGGGLDVSVADQLPEHAFEAIAEHLAANSIVSLPHIMLIGYTHRIGPYSEERIALFNSNHISEKDALRCIEADDYDPNVVVMTKQQWISVFLDREAL